MFSYIWYNSSFENFSVREGLIFSIKVSIEQYLPVQKVSSKKLFFLLCTSYSKLSKNAQKLSLFRKTPVLKLLVFHNFQQGFDWPIFGRTRGSDSKLIDFVP